MGNYNRNGAKGPIASQSNAMDMLSTQKIFGGPTKGGSEVSMEQANTFYDAWVKNLTSIMKDKNEDETNLEQICIKRWTLQGQPDNDMLNHACSNMAFFPKEARILTAKPKTTSMYETYPGSGLNKTFTQGAFDGLQSELATGTSASYITFSGGGDMLTFSHAITSNVNIQLSVDKSALGEW